MLSLCVEERVVTVGLIQGFPASDWIRAREQAREILIRRTARPNPFIPYSDLVTLLDLPIEAHDPRLSVLLDEISTKEHEEGRGFLTALVVHRHGSMVPGAGFFVMARRCGFDFDDEQDFFIKQYKYLMDYWRENRP
jgi:hypothetical protein